jgi:hypothetical protein
MSSGSGIHLINGRPPENVTLNYQAPDRPWFRPGIVSKPPVRDFSPSPPSDGGEAGRAGAFSCGLLPSDPRIRFLPAIRPPYTSAALNKPQARYFCVEFSLAGMTIK